MYYSRSFKVIYTKEVGSQVVQIGLDQDKKFKCGIDSSFHAKYIFDITDIIYMQQLNIT